MNEVVAMERTKAPRWGAMERTLARRTSPWQEAGGLLALVTAGGLWVAVLGGVAAPLGSALARLDALTRAAPPPACATPEGAVASAAQVRPAQTCP